MLKRLWQEFSGLQKKGISASLVIYSGLLPYFIYLAANEAESFLDFWQALWPYLIFWFFVLLFCATMIICFTKLDKKFERDILKQIQESRFKMNNKKPLWFFIFCTIFFLAALIYASQGKSELALIYLVFFELVTVLISLEWKHLFSAKYLAENKNLNQFDSNYFRATFEAKFFGLGIYAVSFLAFTTLITLFALPGWVIFLIYFGGSIVVIFYVFREYKRLEMYQRLKQGKL